MVADSRTDAVPALPSSKSSLMMPVRRLLLCVMVTGHVREVTFSSHCVIPVRGPWSIPERFSKMSDSTDGEITQLLTRVRDGDAEARDQLFSILYRQLKSTAEALMRSERADHTLQASALFNEAFLRLQEGKMIDTADNRQYLFGTLCQAMRCVLVDHARAQRAEKRGGEFSQVPLDAVCDHFEQEHGCRLVELHELLEQLTQRHPRAGRVVELKCFGGLRMDEIAIETGVSKSTVESDWRFAQAWLHRRLRSE